MVTKIFDNYIRSVLENITTDSGVFGPNSSGTDYAPGDNRVPYVMGPTLRRLRKKKKSHKYKK